MTPSKTLPSILTVTGLLYTIPSLALLILLPSVIGYSARSQENLIVGLTIYAVAIRENEDIRPVDLASLANGADGHAEKPIDPTWLASLVGISPTMRPSFIT